MCIRASSYLLQMFTHRGFNVANNDLKKTVDDFMERIKHTTTPDEGCKQIDAARIATARASACIILFPVSLLNSNQLHDFKKMKATGFRGISSVIAPNRIQRKHLTTDSRLRNLIHCGILGVLARQLTRDPTQQTQWHQFNNALCIVQRANNAAGCTHVKWSIPEFQCRFNIGIKTHKPGQGPFHTLNDTEMLAQFNVIDTVKHRDTFLAECSAFANGVNQSRVIQSMVVNNEWITDFMSGFINVCSAKMIAGITKLARSQNLVDLYRFIARVEWMLNDSNVRCVLNLNLFYQSYIQRLVFMSQQGVEHASYILGRHCPEMMTPELNLHVIPRADVYMVPQMQIEPDDVVFGPMKVSCQSFMPPMPDPIVSTGSQPIR
jgi:hypothetical protein